MLHCRKSRAAPMRTSGIEAVSTATIRHEPRKPQGGRFGDNKCFLVGLRGAPRRPRIGVHFVTLLPRMSIREQDSRTTVISVSFANRTRR
jgi:hypothetical protein